MICHNSEMKKQSGFEFKAGTQTVGKDYPRPGFLMGTAIKCYAVERHFEGKGIKPLPRHFHTRKAL